MIERVEREGAIPTLTTTLGRASLEPAEGAAGNADDARRERLGAVGVAFEQDDAEIVPTDPRERIDFTDAPPHDVGELLQCDVSRAVHEAVVVFGEAVDVEQHQAEAVSRPAGTQDLLFELVVEILPVVQVGQRVDEGVVGEGGNGLVPVQVGFRLHRKRAEQLDLDIRERMRILLAEYQGARDVPFAPKRERHEEQRPGVADGGCQSPLPVSKVMPLRMGTMTAGPTGRGGAPDGGGETCADFQFHAPSAVSVGRRNPQIQRRRFPRRYRKGIDDSPS